MEGSILRFLTYLEEVQGSTKNTLAAYHTDLQQLNFVLSHQAGHPILPGDITNALLVSYVNWLKSGQYRPSTISRKMAAVRSYLRFLGRGDQLTKPLTRTALSPPPLSPSQPRVLSRQEIGSLLAAPKIATNPRSLRDAAILSLLYATGLQPAEATGLHVRDVDLIRSKITIPSRRRRTVSLGLATEPVRRYATDARPAMLRDPVQEAFFLNQRGERLSRQGLWLVVKRWARKAHLGDGVSPRTLRHSLVSHMLDQGRSKREIQQTLGLSTPNSLRIHTAPKKQNADGQI